VDHFDDIGRRIASRKRHLHTDKLSQADPEALKAYLEHLRSKWREWKASQVGEAPEPPEEPEPSEPDDIPEPVGAEQGSLPF